MAADGWVYGRRLLRIIVVDKLMERGGGSVAARVWRTHRLMFLTMAKGGDPRLKLIDFLLAKANEFGGGVGWQRSQLNRGGLSGEAHRFG